MVPTKIQVGTRQQRTITQPNNLRTAPGYQCQLTLSSMLYPSTTEKEIEKLYSVLVLLGGKS